VEQVIILTQMEHPFVFSALRVPIKVNLLNPIVSIVQPVLQILPRGKEIVLHVKLVNLRPAMELHPVCHAYQDSILVKEMDQNQPLVFNVQLENLWDFRERLLVLHVRREQFHLSRVQRVVQIVLLDLMD